MPGIFGAMTIAALSAAAAGDAAARAALDDGSTVAGRLRGDAAATAFRGASADVPLSRIQRIEFPSRLTVPSSSGPERRIRLSGGDHITGSILEWDPDAVRLDVRGIGEVSVPRPALASISPPPGVRDVLFDGCSAAGSAWSLDEPEELEFAVPPGREEDEALRLPRSRVAVRCVLERPVDSGSVAVSVLASQDSGWRMDLRFGRPNEADPSSVSVSAGTGRYIVESDGVKLNRYAVPSGKEWVRLLCVFGHDRFLILAGEQVIAAGDRGPRGLQEIRVARRPSTADADDSADASTWVDDLLVRAAHADAELAAAPTPAPSTDFVELRTGDRLFGTILSIDTRDVTCLVAGRELRVPWTDVRRAQFPRREPRSEPPEGWVCRLRPEFEGAGVKLSEPLAEADFIATFIRIRSTPKQ